MAALPGWQEQSATQHSTAQRPQGTHVRDSLRALEFEPILRSSRAAAGQLGTCKAEHNTQHIIEDRKAVSWGVKTQGASHFGGQPDTIANTTRSPGAQHSPLMAGQLLAKPSWHGQAKLDTDTDTNTDTDRHSCTLTLKQTRTGTAAH